MGCATALVKYIIFFFNFVFVMGGTALITFGSLFFTGHNDYKSILPGLEVFAYPPILMIVAGAIIFIIAFMGFCGTLRESRCIMMAYTALLVVALLVEVAIAVVIFTNQDNVKDLFRQQLKESMANYNPQPETKEVWDTMQSNLKCCGADSYSDWIHYGLVPESCCAEPGTATCSFALFSQNLMNTGYFTEGCVDKIYSDVKTEYGMYGAGILALVEVLGILLGYWLGGRFGARQYLLCIENDLYTKPKEYRRFF